MADTDVRDGWTLDDHLCLAVSTRVLIETDVRLDERQTTEFVVMIRSVIESQGAVVVPADDVRSALIALDADRHYVAFRRNTTPKQISNQAARLRAALPATEDTDNV